MGRVRSIVASLGLLAVVAAVPAPARAQPQTAEQRSELVFEEGRKLAAAGRFAEACPKFEESQRLDPGLGTLLNLAACYQELGKLASAWTAFRSAEEQARGAGEKKREQIAAERARALETRVARLTLTLTAGDRPAGFTVTRDGATVTALDFGRRLPVDPGLIVIEATAPGHRPFRVEVLVEGEKVSRVVHVPALEPAAPTSGEVATPDEDATPGVGPAAPVREPRAPAPRRPRRRIGLIVGGVGAAGLVAGVGVGLSARSSYAGVGCTAGDGPPTGCNSEEADAIASARSRGNLGTLIGVVGVAALGAGVGLWLTAPVERVAIEPALGPDGAGVTVTGRF